MIMFTYFLLWLSNIMTLSIYFAIFAAASDGKWKNVKSLLDISKFLGNPNFDFVKKYIV